LVLLSDIEGLYSAPPKDDPDARLIPLVERITPAIEAIAGGADFIKTSTGKAATNATLPVQLCMLEVIRDVHEETGRVVGMKAAGGIRQAKQAVQFLVQVHETLGLAWLTPDRYRLGASTLLNDVLMQIRKERTGRYQNPDYFTVD